ncbi:hypothetical protein EVAR_91522_1 [Eumeta japonica]|uniref:Uncharacterized protein n=1 Tax=Eumeta variegata TaxID=151549 RepID=A0A4C1VAV3_EUMVA|nr:hypothetical protein EVAR_91522_1 [Eumeta japonica]
MVANIGIINSSNAEATAYISAVAAAAGVVLVLLLFLGRRWCSSALFGRAKCCDEILAVNAPRIAQPLDDAQFGYPQVNLHVYIVFSSRLSPVRTLFSRRDNGPSADSRQRDQPLVAFHKSRGRSRCDERPCRYMLSKPIHYPERIFTFEASDSDEELRLRIQHRLAIAPEGTAAAENEDDVTQKGMYEVRACKLRERPASAARKFSEYPRRFPRVRCHTTSEYGNSQNKPIWQFRRPINFSFFFDSIGGRAKPLRQLTYMRTPLKPVI